MTTQVQISLEAQDRAHFGHQNKALRRDGFTPLHVYGLGDESLSLQAPAHDVALTISKVGRTTPLTLTVKGDEIFVMVKEIQRHPVTDALLHVDLLRISRTEKLRVQVPVQLLGEAPAARADGMDLSHDLHEVEVEALPLDMPSVITIDISDMRNPDSMIQLKDLALPSGVTTTGSSDTVLVRVIARRGTSLAAEEIEVSSESDPISDESMSETSDSPSTQDDEASGTEEE